MFSTSSGNRSTVDVEKLDFTVTCPTAIHDLSALVVYEGSALGGRFKPRLCSRLEAGPASPAWQLRDSSKFLTKLTSKSKGRISSSASSTSSSSFETPASAEGWEGLLSKLPLLWFWRKIRIYIMQQNFYFHLSWVWGKRSRRKKEFTAWQKLCPTLVPISSWSIWSM